MTQALDASLAKLTMTTRNARFVAWDINRTQAANGGRVFSILEPFLVELFSRPLFALYLDLRYPAIDLGACPAGMRRGAFSPLQEAASRASVSVAKSRP
jgi:hypothetical protein